MSGSNRRRKPAQIDEVRKLVADIERVARTVEQDYLWLHGSGYTTAHRKDSQQLGDPADLVSGTPARVRHLMTRASEGIDQAFTGILQARYWLAQVVTAIDETASNTGIDEELPTVSRGEVKRAELQQQRRDVRARQSSAPWSFEEVTG